MMKSGATIHRGALVTLLSMAIIGWRRPPAADTVGMGRAIFGLSGNLRAVFALPGEFHRRLGSGADSLALVPLLPFARKAGDRLGGYRLGNWPAEVSAAKGRSPLPAGFIEVTRENRALPVSKRFRLGDFVTHDQQSVWPKYLVLQPRLLDKLELIGQALSRLGRSSALHVMSGFRTPQYNARGVGKLGGRARDSRHMYGDAADIFVDADGDGFMDDLDGDGRVTVADGRFLLAVVAQVEKQYPELVGGLSAYPANAAHGPFVHVDARGHRARW